MRALLLFIVVILLVVESRGSSFESDFALLEDVKTMTFHKGQMTRGRRSAPVKQIDCTSGDACKFFEPEVINCRNLGKDDRGNIQWECKAEMLDLYRLGRTDVGCEGYTSSEDPYILTGSCGVEYTLHLTEKGKQHHLKPKVEPKVQPKKQYRYVPPPPSPKVESIGSIIADVLGFLAIFAIIFGGFICICCCLCCAAASSSGRGGYRPPPERVGFRPPPPHNYGYGNGPTTTREVHHHHTRDDGPGFTTGFMMGRATAPQPTPVVVQAPAPARRRARSPSPDYSSSSSGWGWGGSSSSSSGASSSPKSYTSTGYGGTKKR